MKNSVKTTTLTEAPPTPVSHVREHGPGIGFFAVGMVINIVLIAAFIVWALKQGRKKEKQDD